ncbi:YL1 nuclear protein-domain-containing protein [Fomitopsis serialis]|uniref:YL1 nuclear protein-domain-containing protein n=1 Tax=Fomitopsis serialis TaxID=139415 RepID=UPI002008DF38|nr:YL1 nuclear protein-domain-containing protein [Neoantrodia serialis]KAH9914868.1 YL1 nuclear protein-domain-containing protein [Neoantrodia serialis]
MAEHDDSLVMRRPKRSTAGNRMEAALAEFRAEDVGVDVEEDVDFVVEKDEQDAFGSDFESTDEEEAQEDTNGLEERKAWEDERRSRKTARSKLDRVTAAAHARHKATFNPQLEYQQTRERDGSKVKRRVSMGSVIDAETGEVVEGTKRHSRRSHTMQNTSETASRMKDAEVKKSTVPKKAKTPERLPTQRELIERALKMEEGNIKEHREYLSTEEEKRKKARLVRTAVQGPLLRWISKAEEVTVRVEPPPPAPPSYTYAHAAYPYYPPPPPPPPQSTRSPASNAAPRSYLHVSASYHADLQKSDPSATPQSQPQYPTYSADYHTQYSPPAPSHPQAPSSAPYTHPASQYASHPEPQQTPSTSYSQSAQYTHPYYYYHQQYAQPQVAPSPAEPIERTEKVTKNYVIHELSQQEKQRPPWHSTMKVMFGDHVKWEELRVYTSKGRPLSRPVLRCPITGKVAIYRDPRTNVPFADVAAYETLTKVLEHEYVWNDSLGCYVG